MLVNQLFVMYIAVCKINITPTPPHPTPQETDISALDEMFLV